MQKQIIIVNGRTRKQQFRADKRQKRKRSTLTLDGPIFRFSGAAGSAYRKRVMREQLLADPFCRYCGNRQGDTVDHATPLSRGGGDEPSNLFAACKKCNRWKGSRTLAEWRDEIRQLLTGIERAMR